MLKQADTYIEMLVDTGFGYDRILSLLDNPGFYNLLYSPSFTHLLHRFPLENLSHYARKFLVKMTTNSSILEELMDGDLVSFTVDLLEKKLEHINSPEEHNKPISTRQLSPSYQRRPHEPMSLRPGSSPSHGPTTVHPVTIHPMSTPAHSVSFPDGSSAIPLERSRQSILTAQSAIGAQSRVPSPIPHKSSTPRSHTSLAHNPPFFQRVPSPNSVPVWSTLPRVSSSGIYPNSAFNSQHASRGNINHVVSPSGLLPSNEDSPICFTTGHSNNSIRRFQPTLNMNNYKANSDAVQCAPKPGTYRNMLDNEGYAPGGINQHESHQRGSHHDGSSCPKRALPSTPDLTSIPFPSTQLDKENSAIPWNSAIGSQYPLRSTVTQSEDPFDPIASSGFHPRSTTVTQSALYTLTEDVLVVPQGSYMLQPTPSNSLPVLSVLPRVNSRFIHPGSALNSDTPRCPISHVPLSSKVLSPNETSSTRSTIGHTNPILRSHPMLWPALIPNGKAIPKPHVDPVPDVEPTLQSSDASSHWSVSSQSVRSWHTETTHVGEYSPLASETPTLVNPSSPEWWDRDWSSDSLFSSDNEEDYADGTGQYSDSESGTPHGDTPYRNHESGKPEEPEDNDPQPGCRDDSSCDSDGASHQSNILGVMLDGSPSPENNEEDYDVGGDGHSDSGFGTLHNDTAYLPGGPEEPDVNSPQLRYLYDLPYGVDGDGQQPDHMEILLDSSSDPGYDAQEVDPSVNLEEVDPEYELDDQFSQPLAEADESFNGDSVGEPGYDSDGGSNHGHDYDNNNEDPDSFDPAYDYVEEGMSFYSSDGEQYEDGASQHSDEWGIPSDENSDDGVENPEEDNDCYNERDQYEYGDDGYSDEYLALIFQSFPQSLWSLQLPKPALPLQPPKQSSCKSFDLSSLETILANNVSSHIPFFVTFAAFEQFLRSTCIMFIQNLRISRHFVSYLEGINVVVNYREYLLLPEDDELDSQFGEEIEVTHDAMDDLFGTSGSDEISSYDNNKSDDGINECLDDPGVPYDNKSQGEPDERTGDNRTCIALITQDFPRSLQSLQSPKTRKIDQSTPPSSLTNIFLHLHPVRIRFFIALASRWVKMFDEEAVTDIASNQRLKRSSMNEHNLPMHPPNYQEPFDILQLTISWGDHTCNNTFRLSLTSIIPHIRLHSERLATVCFNSVDSSAIVKATSNDVPSFLFTRHIADNSPNSTSNVYLGFVLPLPRSLDLFEHVASRAPFVGARAHSKLKAKLLVSPRGSSALALKNNHQLAIELRQYTGLIPRLVEHPKTYVYLSPSPSSLAFDPCLLAFAPTLTQLDPDNTPTTRTLFNRILLATSHKTLQSMESFELKSVEFEIDLQVLYLEEGVGLSPINAHTGGNATFSVTIGNHQPVEGLIRTRNPDIPMWNTSLLLMTACLRPHHSRLPVPQVTVLSDISIPFGFLGKLAVPIDDVEVFKLPNKFLFVLVRTRRVTLWSNDTPFSGAHIHSIPCSITVSWSVSSGDIQRLHLPIANSFLGPRYLSCTKSGYVQQKTNERRTKLVPISCSPSVKISQKPSYTAPYDSLMPIKTFGQRIGSPGSALQALYSNEDGSEGQSAAWTTCGRHSSGIHPLTPISACHSGYSPSIPVQQLLRRKNRRLKGGVKTLSLTLSGAHFFLVALVFPLNSRPECIVYDDSPPINMVVDRITRNHHGGSSSLLVTSSTLLSQTAIYSAHSQTDKPRRRSNPHVSARLPFPPSNYLPLILSLPSMNLGPPTLHTRPIGPIRCHRFDSYPQSLLSPFVPSSLASRSLDLRSQRSARSQVLDHEYRKSRLDTAKRALVLFRWCLRLMTEEVDLETCLRIHASPFYSDHQHRKGIGSVVNNIPISLLLFRTHSHTNPRMSRIDERMSTYGLPRSLLLRSQDTSFRIYLWIQSPMSYNDCQHVKETDVHSPRTPSRLISQQPPRFRTITLAIISPTLHGHWTPTPLNPVLSVAPWTKFDRSLSPIAQLHAISLLHTHSTRFGTAVTLQTFAFSVESKKLASPNATMTQINRNRNKNNHDHLPHTQHVGSANPLERRYSVFREVAKITLAACQREFPPSLLIPFTLPYPSYHSSQQPPSSISPLPHTLRRSPSPQLRAPHSGRDRSYLDLNDNLPFMRMLFGDSCRAVYDCRHPDLAYPKFNPRIQTPNYLAPEPQRFGSFCSGLVARPLPHSDSIRNHSGKALDQNRRRLWKTNGTHPSHLRIAGLSSHSRERCLFVRETDVAVTNAFFIRTFTGVQTSLTSPTSGVSAFHAVPSTITTLELVFSSSSPEDFAPSTCSTSAFATNNESHGAISARTQRLKIDHSPRLGASFRVSSCDPLNLSSAVLCELELSERQLRNSSTNANVRYVPEYLTSLQRNGQRSIISPIPSSPSIDNRTVHGSPNLSQAVFEKMTLDFFKLRCSNDPIHMISIPAASIVLATCQHDLATNLLAPFDLTVKANRTDYSMRTPTPIQPLLPSISLSIHTASGDVSQSFSSIGGYTSRTESHSGSSDVIFLKENRWKESNSRPLGPARYHHFDNFPLTPRPKHPLVNDMEAIECPVSGHHQRQYGLADYDIPERSMAYISSRYLQSLAPPTSPGPKPKVTMLFPGEVVAKPLYLSTTVSIQTSQVGRSTINETIGRMLHESIQQPPLFGQRNNSPVDIPLASSTHFDSLLALIFHNPSLLDLDNPHDRVTLYSPSPTATDNTCNPWSPLAKRRLMMGVREREGKAYVMETQMWCIMIKVHFVGFHATSGSVYRQQLLIVSPEILAQGSRPENGQSGSPGMAFQDYQPKGVPQHMSHWEITHTLTSAF